MLRRHSDTREWDSWESNEFIDLNAIFEKVKQKLKLALEESGAVVRSGDLPTVHGHDARFVQLFQDLIRQCN